MPIRCSGRDAPWWYASQHARTLPMCESTDACIAESCSRNRLSASTRPTWSRPPRSPTMPRLPGARRRPRRSPTHAAVGGTGSDCPRPAQPLKTISTAEAGTCGVVEIDHTDPQHPAPLPDLASDNASRPSTPLSCHVDSALGSRVLGDMARPERGGEVLLPVLASGTDAVPPGWSSTARVSGDLWSRCDDFPGSPRVSFRDPASV